jgi:hypothetical protein
VALVRTRSWRLIAGSLALAGLCVCAPTLAAEDQCVSPHVHLELAGKSEWEAEVPALRARLTALGHVDACARVTIRAEATGVSVNVTSGSRSATRHLTEPSELVRTVEALVVLPAPIDSVDESPLVDPPQDASRPSDRRQALPEPVHPAIGSHMEFAAAASARMGGNPLMVGAGLAAFAGLVEGNWLVGVDARWEFADGYVSATPPSGFSMNSGAIGVAVGHRSHIGAFACDALIGPTLVLESQEAFPATTTATEGIGTNALDPRVDLTLRATGPTSSRLRLYAAGDIEVSPHRVVHPKQLDPELPPLPAWTSGVAVGVVWGAR